MRFTVFPLTAFSNYILTYIIYLYAKYNMISREYLMSGFQIQIYAPGKISNEHIQFGHASAI